MNISQQGSFTSTGTAVFLPLRFGPSWIRVWNYSIFNAQTANNGVNYYWRLGMNNNDAMIELFNGAGNALTANTAANLGVAGFQYIDTSINAPLAPVPITEIAAGPPPVVSTANTAGLISGQTVVRLYFQTGTAPYAQQLAGIDFTVGNVMNNASFTLQNMPAIVATSNAIVSNYSIIPFDPIFYPTKRVVCGITTAANAVVTTTVNHGYQVGQQVRFTNANQVTPGAAAYGMTQINNLTGNIIATTATTFTVDINTTGFNAFVFPLTANYPFTPLEVVPVGENTATALAQVPPLDSLNDAVVNTAQIGFLLGAGITSPAGANTNVIYWEAGRDYNV